MIEPGRSARSRDVQCERESCICKDPQYADLFRPAIGPVALLHAPGRSAGRVYKANDARWGTEIFWGEIVEFGAKRHETRADAAAAAFMASFKFVGGPGRYDWINDKLVPR